jgi:hypothetical protein
VAKKTVIVHVTDSPRTSWIEVDGERVEADSVSWAWGEGWQQATVRLSDFEVVDERSGIGT